MSFRAVRPLHALAFVLAALVATVAPARAFAGGFGGEPQQAGMPSDQNIPELVDIEIKDKHGEVVPPGLVRRPGGRPGRVEVVGAARLGQLPDLPEPVHQLLVAAVDLADVHGREPRDAGGVPHRN